ncbi:MAG: hypothetical protein E6575_25650, partial [Bradyrhizobium sp.]|nr:hypothetical protein [Bradyrhizobium sp.]
LPGAPGFLVTVVRMMLTHQRGISVGMPGPRDLTVRDNGVRRRKLRSAAIASTAPPARRP